MKKLLVLAGFIIIIGTAGASDCDTISFGQTIVQGVIGCTMIGIGVK